MNYSKQTLGNGLRIITVPMKENPTVTVMVLVEAGSKYETKEINGLSHFLEHMCFKGTKNRPKAIQIAEELDSIGSSYNAFTSQEYTGYYAKADYRHLDKVLDVVSDMYLNPIFEVAEIEKEKGVIIEEINMYEDLPQQTVQDVFMALLYGDQPAGWRVLGPKEVIKKIERQNFMKYRSEHYVAESTIVVVAGNFNEVAVQTAVADKFRGIECGPKRSKLKVIEAQIEPAIKIQFKETDQTHLVLGFRSFGINHQDSPIIKVLGTVLGGSMSSRLFHKLRNEMGVCYYVRVVNDAYTDHGVFQVSAGVDNKRVAEVIEVVLAEFRKLRTELVPASELKRAKDYLIGNLYLGLESSSELADFYGFQEVLHRPIKKPDGVVKEIEAVSAEEIKRVANSIFTESNLNLALIGRFKEAEEFKKLLKL